MAPDASAFFFARDRALDAARVHRDAELVVHHLARSRACKGPPLRWCSSITLITSGVSLWADFGPRGWGSKPAMPSRSNAASAW